MTEHGFLKWLYKRGWSDEEAAERLGLNRTTVWRYRSGTMPIPDTVERLIEMIDRYEPVDPRRKRAEAED
jgi:transcriptional regulator with XRE-family HTH domain